MKTNQEMVRSMGEFKVTQRTKRLFIIPKIQPPNNL